MPISSNNKRFSAGREQHQLQEPRWVNVVIMTIVVMTIFTLFYESQAMHNQAFQSILSGTTTTTQPNNNNNAPEINKKNRLLISQGGMLSISDPGKYPPFSCSKLLRQLKKANSVTGKQQLETLDPNNGNIKSRLTTTTKPFYISIHNKAFDITRWVIMDTGEYYEKKLTLAFEEVLGESPPGSRVLDVGANIGYFSLLSAAQGRHFIIDSFEPNFKNRIRFCESLNLNRWYRTEFATTNQHHYYDLPPPQKQEEEDEDDDAHEPIVNLYPYGVGQEEGNFVFVEDLNPGMGAVSKVRTTVNNTRTGVRIITLDSFAKERGWFDNNNDDDATPPPPPHVAILKIDVEGNEYQVIEGAQQLLQTNIVHNIFMEISVRTKKEEVANFPCLKFLSAAGYRLFAVGGWPGPGTKVKSWPQDDTLPDRILKAAHHETAKQLNLWWKKKEDETTTRTTTTV